MVNNKYQQLAISLYSFVHAGITENINLVEEACFKCFKDHQGFDSNIRNLIGLHYTVLFIFIVNRLIFNILDENKALKLSSEIDNVFLDHTIKDENKEVEALEAKIFLMEFSTSKIGNYKKYKLVSKEKDGSPKGTLVWEFSKEISAICGYPNDIRIIIAASSGAYPFIQHILDNYEEFKKTILRYDLN